MSWSVPYDTTGSIAKPAQCGNCPASKRRTSATSVSISSACILGAAIASSTPFHQPHVRAEPELLVQRLHIARVQHPATACEGAVLDDLRHELDAEATATILLEHADVREIDEAGRVAIHGARKPDLAAVFLGPDNARAHVD